MVVKREAGLMPDARESRKTRKDEDAAETLDKIENAAGFFGKVQVSASVFLRIVTYIYLRWIPNSLAYRLIPPVFIVYVLSWMIRQLSISNALGRLVINAQLAPAKDDLKELAVTMKENEGNTIKGNGEEVAENIASKFVRETSPGIPSLNLWERIKVVLLGRSTRSTTANYTSLGLHVLLFLFFLDSSWTPFIFPSHHEHNLHFAHIGALGPKSATVHVRYPFPLGHREDYIGALIEQDLEGGSSGGLLRNAEELLSNPEPLRIVYREVRSIIAESAMVAKGSVDGRIRTPSKRWERGPLIKLSSESDWTGSAKLDGLWPATEYEWRLAFAHNSTFTAMPSYPRKFVTWPDPRLSEEVKSALNVVKAAATDGKDDVAPFDDPSHFTFASSSCIKPDFPWAPTQFWAWSWALRFFGLGDGPGGFAMRNRIVGFDKLAESTIDGREKPSIRFFLQLGDAIYVDSPYYAGPFDWTYRKLYRNLFASESFRRVYERLPIIGIYDDHEVINNWGGGKLESAESGDEDGTVKRIREPEELRPAIKAWQEYVGSANPEPVAPGQNYYTFRYGDTAFFVMDTRMHRSPWQIEDNEDKTMLGLDQRDAFVRWLSAVNSTATFKFVVSSVPFNTLWGGPLDWDGKTDSWAAYTSEREYLLQYMQYVPNVIVLSGDRHEFASVGIARQGSRADYHPITEFSTSPLSMFYLPVRTLSQSHGLGPTGAERLYKYLPDGNVKWSEFEVDTRDTSDPQVRVKVVVDGKPAWTVTVHGQPVLKPRTAVGGMAHTFLELLRWRPRRWF